jgi:endoglucanase
MLLKDLTQTFGVSGYEKGIREVIINSIKDYADEITVDAIGNIIALKKGNGENKKRIMASAHMDEIGFSVVSVTDKGYLKVRPVGGLSAHTSFMNRIRFKNEVVGIVCCGEPVDGIKPADINKLYIDIGAKSKEDALKLIKIGEIASYVGEYVELANNRVTAKALDDRIGCYVQVEALKKMTAPYNDVYFVFSVQEEVGLRGAKVAANRINPDLGIAVDITGSFDTPDGAGKGNAVLGEGAAVKVMDGSVICDEYLVEEMVKTAEQNGIKYQLDVLAAGGTDAGAINLSNDGVKSSGISIPERYAHSPNGIVDMFDVECCINLLVKFADREFKF